MVQSPGAIAIDLRGNPAANKWAYVADTARGRIVKFGTGGRVLTSWRYALPAQGSEAPAAIAVGGNGNVFVANAATGVIDKFSPAGRLLHSWSGFASAVGIAVDAAGHIFVARSDGYAVDELSGGGSYLATIDTHTLWAGDSVGKPLAVALDPRDHTWYLATRCQVTVDCGRPVPTIPGDEYKDILFELAGSTPRQFWPGLGYLQDGTPQETPAKEAEPFITIDAMTNDARGHVYVAGDLWPLGRRHARGVVEYNPTGEKIGYWWLPSQSPVSGIAVDGRRAIYVSQDGKVLTLAS